MRFLTGGLLLVTLAYVFFMFLEWTNISHKLESVENIVGASIPMMWAFFLYSFMQNRTKEDLALSKENLRITLDSIGDAVIATDIYGKITRMNPVAESITGWKKEDATGRKIDDVLILHGYYHR